MRATARRLRDRRGRLRDRAWPPGGSGAGRARKEDPVSAAAGVVLHRAPGGAVQAGDVLYELRADDAARMPAALEAAKRRYGSVARRRLLHHW